MVAKLKQEQAKLTEKIQSREGWRDTFKGMKDKADFKKMYIMLIGKLL